MKLSDLEQDLVTSLKSGKRDRVETLRYLLAAIKNHAIERYGNKAEEGLTDDDVLDVVKKQVKTHRESIEAFEKGGREDLVAKEKAQLAILEEFLPAQLSDSELAKLLEPVVSSGETNFGLLMKSAMAAVAGRADGGRVASMLKQMIQT